MRDDRPFWLGLAISLAFHVLVLCIKLASPDSVAHTQARQRDTRVEVTLANPASPPQTVATPPPQAKRPEPRPRVLMAKPKAITDPARTWSRAEKDDMDQFLNELEVQAKPPTGRELAQRAIAMAGRMAVPEQQDDELQEMRQKFANANVDPFSIEMYFDALFRKMNHSAAMISKEGINKGTQVASVRVVVNQDGTVKSFRVLWAADQQSEIAYIKSVVEQAAPFPVFPQDIRDATNSVVLQICIQPNSRGGFGGATFSRMSPGSSCRG
jgi:hypothetical protein